jgi:hypothetical protein
VAVLKTTSEEPLRSKPAPHAISQFALCDESLPPRPDGVDRVWIDWVRDSIPEIGPSATSRGASIWEAMRATA